jgi:hypothetical protein
VPLVGFLVDSIANAVFLETLLPEIAGPHCRVHLSCRQLRDILAILMVQRDGLIESVYSYLREASYLRGSLGDGTYCSAR